MSDDARRRLVQFSTALLDLYFQTRPQIWREQSYLYNELSSLSAGWRRSANRTRLQPDSLQTGNFTGKLAILEAWRQALLPKTAAMQRILGRFPTPTNREMTLIKQRIETT